MPTQDAERREYYRIEDRVALQITPLSAEQIETQQPLYDDSALFGLLGELGLMDYETQHLLRQIDDQNRNLGAFLRLLNKRVDLIAQALAQQVCNEFGDVQTVMLSEDGISFNHEQALAGDTQLALRMLLMPQALGLLLRARVIHCQPQENGQYEIGAQFEALTDAQRQLLARHILQKQALARRQARELSEQP
jgi:c-di-GMP-binding flagellar brake protein YcgR